MAKKISPSTQVAGMMARKVALMETDGRAMDAAHARRMQEDITERAEQKKAGQELFTSLHEKTRAAFTKIGSKI